MVAEGMLWCVRLVYGGSMIILTRCQVMVCYVRLGYIVLGLIGHFMLGQVNTVNATICGT